MKKVSLVLVIFWLVFVSLEAQEQKQKDIQFATYQEMRAYIGKLFQKKEYAEAAKILEKALTQFPDHLHANTYNLALMYVHLEEAGKALKILEYDLDQGGWFGKYDFMNEMWAPLRELEEFKSFEKKNEAKRQEAQKTAEPKLEVFTPENYDKDKKYPLFIALHGGGENIDSFKP